MQMFVSYNRSHKRQGHITFCTYSGAESEYLFRHALWQKRLET